MKDPRANTEFEHSALRVGVRGALALCVSLCAAAGPLAQLLHVAEVPATDQEQPSRYELVLAHVPAVVESPASQEQPGGTQQTAPRLHQALTDLWDTAQTVLVAEPGSVAALTAPESARTLRPTLHKQIFYSQSPPLAVSRGPPAQA